MYHKNIWEPGLYCHYFFLWFLKIDLGVGLVNYNPWASPSPLFFTQLFLHYSKQLHLTVWLQINTIWLTHLHDCFFFPKMHKDLGSNSLLLRHPTPLPLPIQTSLSTWGPPQITNTKQISPQHPHMPSRYHSPWISLKEIHSWYYTDLGNSSVY